MTETTHFPLQKLTVTEVEEYTYDKKHRLLKTKTKLDRYNRKARTQTIYSFEQAATNSLMKSMFDKNMIDFPIEKTLHIDNDFVSKETYSYSESLAIGKKLILPYQVSSQIRGGDTYIQSTISKYDNIGNPLVVESKTGERICLVWSYCGQYPIAMINNATYSDVCIALGGEASVVALSKKVTPTDVEMKKINDLRKNTGSLKNALISTYTYKPLVGLTSETNVSGFTTYYEYDSFGRLKRTYFKEKNTGGGTEVENDIQSYHYNYQDK